ASAQEEERPTTTLAAPSQAFEGRLMAGYTQPFGLVRAGQNINDVAGPAAGFELGLGYRLSPRFGIQLNGQYDEGQANPVNGVGSRGVATGADVDFHFLPYGIVDPWLQAGVGYRFMWNVGDAQHANVMDHGLRLLRLMAGVDLRQSTPV